jgi:hypothetical protein
LGAGRYVIEPYPAGAELAGVFMSLAFGIQYPYPEGIFIDSWSYDPSKSRCACLPTRSHR